MIEVKKYAYIKGRSIYLDDETLELQPDWETERPALELLSDLAAKIKTPALVDVGAGVGIFTLLATIRPDMFVYAFEPQPAMLNVLARNIVQNRVEDRVLIYPMALSAYQGDLVLHCPKKRSQAGLAHVGTKPPKDGYSLHIMATTLDQALSASAWRSVRVDLLKIDVEGAEFQVLMGAEGTIKRDKPAIIAETQDKRTRQFGYDAIRIVELLEGWGYQHRPIDKRNTFFWSE